MQNKWRFAALLGLAFASAVHSQVELNGGDSNPPTLTSVWVTKDAQGNTLFTDTPPKKGQAAEVRKIALPSSSEAYAAKKTNPERETGKTQPIHALPHSAIALPPLPPVQLPNKK